MLQERDFKAAGATKFPASPSRLAECLAFLRASVLMVTKPDLARSTAELLAIEAGLSKRGVGLVVLSMRIR